MRHALHAHLTRSVNHAHLNIIFLLQQTLKMLVLPVLIAFKTVCHAKMATIAPNVKMVCISMESDVRHVL